MFTFVKKVYKNKKRDYLILLLIMSLLASFEYCSLAMYSSLDVIGDHFITQMIVNVFPTLTTFIALMLSIFVLKYFIENKKQEFSILLLSGRKPKDLFIYILYQFGFLSLFAFFIGIIGGYIFISMMNMIIQYLSLSFQFQHIFIKTIAFYLCFFVFTIIFILMTCSHQFVVLDKNIVCYLNHKKESKQVPYKAMLSATSSTTKKKKPIFSIIQTIVILYITVFSFIKLLDPHLEFQMITLFYMTALSGIVVIVNITFPLLYDILHHRFIKHPILLNTIACFNDFSSIMKIHVNLNACLVPTMVFLVIVTGQDLLLQIIMIPCFTMTLIMVGLCFLLRYSFYDEDIRATIATYHAIGYNFQQLHWILIFKNIIFTLFGVLISWLLFILLSYRAFIGHLLSKEVLIGLSLIYLILYLLILIYMFIKEKRMLKEVTNHVKYFNRGQ